MPFSPRHCARVLALAAVVSSVACGQVADCPASGTDCSGICVDLQNDAENCGACGTPCGTGQVCSAGKCTPVCGAYCDDVCVDLAHDDANCGTCGNACPGGQKCIDSKCQEDCGAGLSSCGSACVDVTSDSSNCGTCGHVCDAHLACVAGQCAPLCSSGQTACVPQNASPYCADLSSDPSNCGVCGVACGANGYCSSGQCQCTGTLTWCGTCVDTESDPNNCHSCGTSCGTGACSHAHCVIELGTLFTWTPTAQSLVADNSNVYYTNSASVSAIPNGGGTASLLTSGYIPSYGIHSLAKDAANIYFVDGGVGASRVCKVSKGGGTVTVLASVSDTLRGLAVDATNVYAHGANGVYGVPIGGGSLTTLAPGDLYTYTAPSIVADGTSLYWIAGGTDVVGMAASGGTITTLYSGTYMQWLVGLPGTYWQLLFDDYGGMFQLQPKPTLTVSVGAANTMVPIATAFVAYVCDGVTIYRYNQQTHALTPLVDVVAAVAMAASDFYLTWFDAFGALHQVKTL